MRPQERERAPARDPAAIQAEIEQAREEITRSVLMLRERMGQATDWRVWAARWPFASLGLALGLGLWLGYQGER